MRRHHDLRSGIAALAALAVLALPAPARPQEDDGAVGSPGFCATLGEMIAGSCGLAQEEVEKDRGRVPSGTCTRAAVAGKRACDAMGAKDRTLLLTGAEAVSLFCSSQVRGACDAQAVQEAGVAPACPRLASLTRTVVRALVKDRR